MWNLPWLIIIFFNEYLSQNFSLCLKFIFQCLTKMCWSISDISVILSNVKLLCTSRQCILPSSHTWLPKLVMQWDAIEHNNFSSYFLHPKGCGGLILHSSEK